MTFSTGRLYLLFAVATALPTSGYAEIGTQASVGYSDNIDRSEAAARSERLLTAVIGGQTSASYGDLEREVRWEVGAIDYLGGTYDLESIAALDAVADFALLERRLVWRIEDRLGLQNLDPFMAATPGSREYVNFLVTGPELRVPLSPAAALVAGINVSDVWYEDQPLDNSRNGTLAGVQFGLGPRRSIGLFTTKLDYEFDDSTLTDYTRRQVYLNFQTQRRRGSLRAALGMTEISGVGDPIEQPMVELEWDRVVSDYSTFAVTLQRGFFGEGDVFSFDDTVGGGVGTTQAIAGVGNPLSRTAVTARFAVSKSRMSAIVGYNVTRDEYEGLDSALNREMPMLNFQLSRTLSARLRVEFQALYTQQDALGSDVEDEDRRASLGLAWRLGRRAELNFTLARSERASTIAGASYEENRVFVTFGYGADISGVQMSL